MGGIPVRQRPGPAWTRWVRSAWHGGESPTPGGGSPRSGDSGPEEPARHRPGGAGQPGVLQGLAQFPEMGANREELMPGLRSLPVGNYLVFYLPIERGIEIVRILPGMRDIDALF